MSRTDILQPVSRTTVVSLLCCVYPDVHSNGTQTETTTHQTCAFFTNWHKLLSNFQLSSRPPTGLQESLLLLLRPNMTRLIPGRRRRRRLQCCAVDGHRRAVRKRKKANKQRTNSVPQQTHRLAARLFIKEHGGAVPDRGSTLLPRSQSERR